MEHKRNLSKLSESDLLLITDEVIESLDEIAFYTLNSGYTLIKDSGFYQMLIHGYMSILNQTTLNIISNILKQLYDKVKIVLNFDKLKFSDNSGKKFKLKIDYPIIVESKVTFQEVDFSKMNPNKDIVNLILSDKKTKREGAEYDNPTIGLSFIDCSFSKDISLLNYFINRSLDKFDWIDFIEIKGKNNNKFEIVNLKGLNKIKRIEEITVTGLNAIKSTKDSIPKKVKKLTLNIFNEDLFEIGSYYGIEDLPKECDELYLTFICDFAFKKNTIDGFFRHDIPRFVFSNTKINKTFEIGYDHVSELLKYYSKTTFPYIVYELK